MDRLKTMLKVDTRRMFTTRLFYIMVGIALCMPIAILVMTSSLAGTENIDPKTGEVTVVEGFDSAWQMIGSEGGFDMMSKGTASAQADESSDMGSGMDMTSMCNINLVYMMTGIFLCLFVGEDFRSGYAKNLFTVRAKKGDYVASKTIMGLVAGTAMLIAFFIGTLLGGKIAGLPFDLGNSGIDGLVMCMLAKILLTGVFAAIFLAMSVYAKKKTWLSILLSLGAGMLLFMMIPMVTPLDSSIMNVVICLAGSAMFCFGLGAISKLVLNKTSLV
ncbi:MAG: ABC transporter permease [Ruminococcus sp.]|nr:ABC transporter permease [Ruminococcus sp.]